MKTKNYGTLTYKLSSIFDTRNIAIQAVIETRAVVKLEYPFKNGLQINVKFTDLKQFANFIIRYDFLLKQVKPESLKLNEKEKECTFFCCYNCKDVNKENKNKLITNLCNNCANEHVQKNIEKVEAKRKSLEVKEVKDLREPIYSQFLKEKEEKKKVNPVKLKFK